jgi:hypothetical protein
LKIKNIFIEVLPLLEYKMDCSICMEEINGQTGQALLSCGHVYHIGCVARWLSKHDSCPYCRHLATEKERISDGDTETDSEYDDEPEPYTNEDLEAAEQLRWIRVGRGRWRVFDSTQFIPDYDSEDHALWVFRTVFGTLDDPEGIPPVIPKDSSEEHETIESIRVRHRVTDDMLERGYESA